MIGLIVLGVLALLVIYVIVLYNGFVAMKNSIDRDWSNIDVMLKQRFDELPKLIKVCQGYMEHEHQTLEAVVKARAAINSAGSDNEKLAAQNALSDTLKSLFMVVERYPELKADKGFRQLANRITELEDQIADRRELVNSAVTIYNTRLDQFPDVVVARMFNFTSRPLWKINPSHRQDVEVNFT
jgi:LemA protein